jgi:hypothetical protein
MKQVLSQHPRVQLVQLVVSILLISRPGVLLLGLLIIACRKRTIWVGINDNRCCHSTRAGGFLLKHMECSAAILLVTFCLQELTSGLKP